MTNLHTLFSRNNTPASERSSQHVIFRLIARERWHKLRAYFSAEGDISEVVNFDHMGMSALHFACRYNPPLDIVQILAEACSGSAYLQDSLGQTPLHVAAANRASPMIIEYLLRQNPEAASTLDSNGRTPLMLALSLQQGEAIITTDPKVVVALCDAAPASINVEDSSDKSALEYSIVGNAELDVIRFLMRRSKKERVRHDTRRKQLASRHPNGGQIQVNRAAIAA